MIRPRGKIFELCESGRLGNLCDVFQSKPHRQRRGERSSLFRQPIDDHEPGSDFQHAADFCQHRLWLLALVQNVDHYPSVDRRIFDTARRLIDFKISPNTLDIRHPAHLQVTHRGRKRAFLNVKKKDGAAAADCLGKFGCDVSRSPGAKIANHLAWVQIKVSNERGGLEEGRWSSHTSTIPGISSAENSGDESG